MYIREHISGHLGKSVFARRTPGEVEAVVWSHGSPDLAENEATMFMNEVLTSLGPANVAVFDGICTVLGSE